MARRLGGRVSRFIHEVRYVESSELLNRDPLEMITTGARREELNDSVEMSLTKNFGRGAPDAQVVLPLVSVGRNPLRRDPTPAFLTGYSDI